MAIPFRWRLRFLFLLNSVPVLCVVRRSNQGLGSRRVVGLEAKRAGQVLSPPSAMCLVKFGMAGGTRPVCVTLAMDGYGHRCCMCCCWCAEMQGSVRGAKEVPGQELRQAKPRRAVHGMGHRGSLKERGRAAAR